VAIVATTEAHLLGDEISQVPIDRIQGASDAKSYPERTSRVDAFTDKLKDRRQPHQIWLDQHLDDRLGNPNPIVKLDWTQNETLRYAAFLTWPSDLYAVLFVISVPRE
ncbi:MAG: hypothetical protein M1296_03440, partial [Chloroflexi bacterium]|nr:hypothetical protein [Chloroflexota bacterium]